MPPRTRATSGPVIAEDAAVTLVLGASDYFHGETVDVVWRHARAADPHVEKLVIEDVTDAAALAEALDSDMFGGAKLVVIEESESLPEDAQAAVLATVREICAGQRDDLRLILWHTNAVKARKFADELRKAGAHEVVATKLKTYQLDDYLTEQFHRRKRKVEPGVAEAMRMALGEDLAVLVSSVRALCEDVQESPITLAHVAMYQPGLADVPGWEVADAVLSAEPQKVMRLVRRAFAADPNCAPALVAATASGLRQLVAFIPVRGDTDASIASQIGVPPFKVKNLRAQLRHWRPETLSRATVLLSRADVAAKGQTRDGEGLEPEARLHEVESALVGIAGLSTATA
jgi:DNA polymerase-3 subunit delta